MHACQGPAVRMDGVRGSISAWQHYSGTIQPAIQRMGVQLSSGAAPHSCYCAAPPLSPHLVWSHPALVQLQQNCLPAALQCHLPFPPRPLPPTW